MTNELEPILSVKTANGNVFSIPQLAFGCYKVPDNPQGETILQNALQAGYRHFDTASYYGNEATLGRVLCASGIPRGDFFLASKVWNDAQKQGTVRASVLKSLEDLNFADDDNHEDNQNSQKLYWDVFLVHWPVPGKYVETYHELERLQQEGYIKAIGLSNFSVAEYQHLMKSATVPPVLNQFEISPFMYRPDDIKFFQSVPMIVAASKAMYRGAALDHSVVQTLAQTHQVTPSQIMIRWSLQKQLVVLTMSSSLEHQQQNRHVLHFCLSPDEMNQLDALTSPGAVQERTELEKERKTQL